MIHCKSEIFFCVFCLLFLAQCSSAKIMLDKSLRGLINRSLGRLFLRMYSEYLPFKDAYIIPMNSAGLRCFCLESMDVFTIPNHFSTWQLMSLVLLIGGEESPSAFCHWNIFSDYPVETHSKVGIGPYD